MDVGAVAVHVRVVGKERVQRDPSRLSDVNAVITSLHDVDVGAILSDYAEAQDLPTDRYVSAQCSSRASVALTTNLADGEVGARFVDVRVDELQLEAGIVHRGEHLALGLVTPGLLTSVYRSWHKSRRRYHPRRPCSHEHTRPEIQALVDALRLAMLARGIRGQMMHTAAGDNSCNSGEEESKLGEHVERWFKVRSLLDSRRDECSGVALPPERRRSYRCEGHC